MGQCLCTAANQFNFSPFLKQQLFDPDLPHPQSSGTPHILSHTILATQALVLSLFPHREGVLSTHIPPAICEAGRSVFIAVSYSELFSDQDVGCSFCFFHSLPDPLTIQRPTVI